MTAPLPVLLVVDGLWVGGTERSLVETLPLLADHGIDARVACLRRRREGVEDQVPPDRLLLVPEGALLAQARGLRKLQRRWRPAVVHSALFRANLVSRLACAGLPVRLVNSLVSDSYSPHRLADPRIRRWRLRLVQAADAVTGRLLTDHFHAVSHSVAAAARRRLAIPAKRITVIERGRDPGRLGEPSPERRQRARRALGISDDDPVVVHVGRQELQKGQDLLLRAVALLAGRHPRLVLLIAGRRGGATPSLDRLIAELGLGGQVRLLGHRDDVPEILAAGDVFAFPSLYEGYPGAVLEAMALGLPVVASDIGPVREILESSVDGLLVPPSDVSALADALDRVLSAPERAADLGRQGRRHFLARHTLERSAARTADLYRRLADTAVSMDP